jgi:hypothetical protein
MVLLIAVVASLSSRAPWGRRAPSEVSAERSDRKADFSSFGRSYFLIAERADAETGRAYKELRAYAAGKREIGHVQSAFRAAAHANERASSEYRKLSVPPSLASQLKIKRSVETMARAYGMRKAVCETVETWDGDANDRSTLDRYESQTEEVRHLTEDGVEDFASAAYENGLTSDEIRGLVDTTEMSVYKLFPMPFSHHE